MNQPPLWISIADMGSEKEWLFLDSQSPDSSCTMGFNWIDVPFVYRSSSLALNLKHPAPVIEIEPRARSTIQDTAEHLFSHFLGEGMDWAVHNRLSQCLSGVTCDRADDGTVNIWQCTVVGDIFLQQLNINQSAESSRASSEFLVNRSKEWIKRAGEIETLNRTPLLNMSSDMFDNSKCSDDDDYSSMIEECDGNHLDAESIPTYTEPQHARTDDFNLIWLTNKLNGEDSSQSSQPTEEESEPGPSFGSSIPKIGFSYHSIDMTFSEDFEDPDLISSTPLQGKVVQPKQFLKPFTSTQKR